MPVSSGFLSVWLSCDSTVCLRADSATSCVLCFGCCEAGCVFASTDDSSFARAIREPVCSCDTALMAAPGSPKVEAGGFCVVAFLEAGGPRERGNGCATCVCEGALCEASGLTRWARPIKSNRPWLTVGKLVAGVAPLGVCGG